MNDCKCTGTFMDPCGTCYQAQLLERARRAEPTWDEFAAQLSRAGLPPLAITQLGQGLGATDALRAARAFFDAPFLEASGLALLGPPGGGKTVAAGWLMHQVLKDKGWNNVPTGYPSCPVAFVEAGQLTGISAKDKLDADWLEFLERVTLLVLDDAGDEGTPAGVGELAKLIKTRQGRKRRTAVTSNLRREAFVQRYGPAVQDRMRVVELAGKSMRQRRPEVRT